MISDTDLFCFKKVVRSRCAWIYTPRGEQLALDTVYPLDLPDKIGGTFVQKIPIDISNRPWEDRYTLPCYTVEWRKTHWVLVSAADEFWDSPYILFAGSKVIRRAMEETAREILLPQGH